MNGNLKSVKNSVNIFDDYNPAVRSTGKRSVGDSLINNAFNTAKSFAIQEYTYIEVINKLKSVGLLPTNY